MATFAPIDVAPVLLGTTDTIVGQPPVGKSWAIARVAFCNTDTVDRTVTIGTNDSGSLTDAQKEHDVLTIQAKTTLDYGPAYLPATRRLIAFAEVAAKVSARIHGIEKTP
jgi:hypothetical protein